MRDDEEIALAKSLPKGARNALLAMTERPQLPGRNTFNANGAFNLTWKARAYGGLAKYSILDRRAAYYLTPLGVRIRDRILAASADRSAERHDPQGHGPQDESAVPDRADAPKGAA